MPIYAQDLDGPILDVYTEVAGDTFEQNVPFAVAIMVQHPNPAEVRVQPPDFDENFSVERIRTEVRFIKNNEKTPERWTSVEFLLLPSQSGNLSIGSFEVAIPGRTAATRRIAVKVLPEKNSKTQLRWVGRDIWGAPPESIPVGKYGYAALRLSGWERGKNAPELPLRIDTTENAIIDTVPVPASDRTKGIVLLLQILPLEEKPINIASHTFRYEGRTLEVPSLTIKAAAAPIEEEGFDESNKLPAEQKLIEQEVINDRPRKKAFPVVKNQKINPIIKIAYEKKIQNAKELWKAGNRAAAIAGIRQGERDLLAGPFLAEVCKSMEDTVSSSLPVRHSEKWRPRSLLIILTCSFGLLLIGSIIILIFNIKNKSILYGFACLFIVGFGISGVFLLSSINMVGKKGVVEKTYLQTIPESGISTEQVLEEGQIVNIRSVANGWTYIEGINGKAGWAPSSVVHSY
ncbi:hypothetical protein FACS1894190_13890 [Spirochaetia bacterium]|nr:hypothetical protein FACS1894190_13890 [Spirochaetia bacterium]